MSLLLQALQKAAKNRETAQQPPAEPATTGFATNSGSTLELEPGEIEPAPRSREFDAPAEPPAPPPPAPSRTARDDYQEPTAQQAAVVVGAAAAAKEPGFSIIDWARDHPVHIFAVIAGIFLAFYFVYVAVEIKYPGFWSRSGSIVGPAANNGPLVRNPSPRPAPPETSPAPTQATAPMPDLLMPSAPGEPAPATPAAGAAPAPAAGPSAPPPAPAIGARPSADAAAPGGAPVAAASRPAVAPKSDRPPVAASSAIVRTEPGVPTARPKAPPGRDVQKAAAADNEISFKTSDGGSAIGGWLTTAYDQLQKGDLDAALGTYEKVLHSDSRNVDALLGLASIAWQRGQTEKASEFYYRVLQLDPQNATAQSGLIGLMGRVDPTASETRLKQLIAREPSGGLYFSLGNLYAGERLWSQAQQAYFQAFQMEPTNPDYAFNLAVGLEHLGQSKVALGYYRKALDLSFARGHAGFDQKQVITRIGELSAATE
jgi:Tfp pilus assembly protein PilF